MKLLDKKQALLGSELLSRERVYQEARNRFLHEMEELRKAQEWRADERARQKKAGKPVHCE